jgi:cytochrome d ubiquinol oxidase subunit II
MDAPLLWEGFHARAWPLVGASILGGLLSLWALLRYRFTLAVIGAGLAVSTVIGGWGVAQYPFLAPPALTLSAAKSPEAVLWALVWSIAGGAVLLGPALAWLFYLFKGKRPDAVA